MTPLNKPFLYCLLLPCLLLSSGCEMKPKRPCATDPGTCDIPKPPHRQHSNAITAATAETAIYTTTETAGAPRAETAKTAAKSAEQPSTTAPVLTPATATAKSAVKSSPGLKTRFYTIQLGAYQKAASRENAINRFQDRHNLYHYPIRKQLTAVSYGIYTSKESAQEVIPLLRSQGFSDPLIRTLPLDFRRIE